MSDKNNQPAMPTAEWQIKGMTLRDYFAAKAMQGAIASSSDKLDFGIELGAVWAYLVADAMLKARGEQ